MEADPFNCIMKSTEKNIKTKRDEAKRHRPMRRESRVQCNAQSYVPEMCNQIYNKLSQLYSNYL